MHEEIHRLEAFKLAVEQLPEFSRYWKEHLVFWGDDKPGITNDFFPLIDYCYDKILKADDIALEKTVQLIEKFIRFGDSNVSYGATIGFLEGLTNRLSNEKEKPAGWTIFLDHAGAETLKFLHQLDGYWGTKTPGL